ncbi:hypothetical protein FSP39_001850 [Pinctada imbricata]|uniref:TNF receptor-associated factor 3 n=1 Tax=Pinctada imbricata TaxID=66713 RepID=A0AA88XTX5_PINIB|nr:hypothetical protein FSP39_001850 [Pinctada imbricata]
MCKICNDVLRDAVQTFCGHRLCLQCIDQALQGRESIPCPAKEEGCVDLKCEEINRDSSARREVRALDVFCPFEDRGCKKTLQWKDLQTHEETCEFRPVPCPNYLHGCEVIISYKDVDEHLKECPYRPYRCQFCNQEVPLALKQQHETETCPRIPIPCRYECGINPLPREELEAHLITCPKRPQRCRYHSVGCTFEGTSEEVQQHERDDTDRHLELITMYTANMDLQSLEVRRELQDMSLERDNSRRLLDDVSRQMAEIKRSMDDMKIQVRDVKLKIVSQTERIIHVERKVEDLAKKDSVDRHARDLQVIRETQASMSERIHQLEGRAPSQGNPAVPAIEGNTGSVVPQVQQHERQLGLQDIRLAELDLRFQVLETASYDGTLIWKIKDYSRRKQDAITGRTLSLYSQPFYTSRTGYKMCARVYLNGDGMGRGTHLSLFFVIMRGEYDTLLSWPFKQKVTLMLLDQDTGTRHLSDTFRPDPSSSSFRKPTTEMNVASGCPLFVSHAVLETRTYVREDTIFIKIIVDTEGLYEDSILKERRS